MEFSPLLKFPIFDCSNYAYWKARMKLALKSFDERVWLSVINGWSPPTHLVDNERVPKPADRWSEEEFKLANINSRGLNALFSAVTPDEFRRIMTCDTTKEAWNILQLTHEGTSVVKASKPSQPKHVFDSSIFKFSLGVLGIFSALSCLEISNFLKLFLNLSLLNLRNFRNFLASKAISSESLSLSHSTTCFSSFRAFKATPFFILFSVLEGNVSSS